VTAAFTLILGAAALAVGLAFGLGNRELAGEITRRWYEEGQRRDRRTSDRNGHRPGEESGSETRGTTYQPRVASRESPTVPADGPPKANRP